jgi:osmotically-inducible protein OsmY
MKDDSLSFTAKNVKIITVSGKVTLRGPVKTTQERAAIEAAARRIAGATQVDNQIEVK